MKRNRLLSRMVVAGAALGLTASVGLFSGHVFFGHGTIARAADTAATQLKLEKGDHIAVLGNALPDRMQHDGWLDTLITAKYPDYDLVIRNLSAAADEVGTWHRSENFGTRDEWLAKTKADVILAFYGFNESFKGDAGLDQFKGDLKKFIGDMKTAKFGKKAPRLVLFSPVAAEKAADPNLPNPTRINENLKKYTAAMSEVCKAEGVQFVNLFDPSLRVFEEGASQKKQMTVDGIHLTQEADKKLAPDIFRETLGESAPEGDFEKLRAAIVERNEQWHNRYRTVDGYNVYGGRSALAYQPGVGAFKQGIRNPEKPFVSNYQVMQEEMTQRDVITAHAEKQVWAVAQGKDPASVPAEPLPPVETVKTNKPGENADGSHKFLSGEEAISKMTLAKGCKINLWASEEQFPELIKPLQMAWDTKGRLWVAVWRNYPERTPDSKVGDSILIFEDTKGTGKADKVTHWMDDLNCPTGFQFYKDGILLMQAPDLWYVPTGADGKADRSKMERVLMGMDSADSHHTTNSMVLDPGGATFLSDGVFHRTQVETAAGPVRNSDGCVYRFEPLTGRFERYAAYGFANPHGRVFDYWGTDIITDATGNASYFAPAFSGHIDYPGKHPGMEQFWKRPSRPCPGTGLLSSRHFPDDWQQNFLNINVIGFQGIWRVKMTEEGSGVRGETLEDLVVSTDPNFRPSQINNGPDGALYMADWQAPLIGHMQHHLRDPNRDHQHGRLYRITYEGRPLLKQPKIDGQPVAALLDLLKEFEDGTRTLAKIELGKHSVDEVIPALKTWVAGLDKNDANYDHNMTEALWVSSWFNVVDEDLLKQNLESKNHHVRAAATRVLCYWRDRVPAVLDLLTARAADPSPRVRLEAVRAASFFSEPKAIEVALTALGQSTDYYLDYCLKETMKQLEPVRKEAVAKGVVLGANNPAAFAYISKNMTVADLLKMPRTPGVLQTILTRAGVADTERMAALVELATQKKEAAAKVLIDGVKASANDPAAATAMARMLPAQPQDDLVKVRGDLVALGEGSAIADVRQAAVAATAAADGTFDKIWAGTAKSNQKLVDALAAIPLVFDQDLRTTMQAKVKTYLAPQLPSELQNGSQGQRIKGRYVRIELPTKGALSLAEVQVFSGGKNVAVGAKASQSSTAAGGEAGHAVDGKINGAFGSGTVTQTEEKDKKSPWWQVDLGSEQPIDSIVVWNRTDNNGKWVKPLEGFTVSVLDGNKGVTFKKEKNPAPTENAKFQVSVDELAAVRRAAVRAAVSITNDQPGTFKTLVALLAGDQVTAVAKGIRQLPRTAWSKEDAATGAKALVAWAKTIPAGERTDEEFIQTVQLAADLSGSLPADQATALRAELKQLRVAVFVVNTVREQMRYDTPRLVVEAGKPFEIIFANVDFMPHNLVVVNPGQRLAVAALSATMKPDELDNQGRSYIPKTRDILAGTKLVEAGEKVKINITAPGKEGDYEYVCTFPGHAESMWGKLIVTKDVDAYLAAHPDAGSAGTGMTPAEHKAHTTK